MVSENAPDIYPYLYGAENPNQMLTHNKSSTLAKSMNPFSTPKSDTPFEMTVNLKDKTIISKDFTSVETVEKTDVKVIGGNGEITIIGNVGSIEVYSTNGILIDHNNNNIKCHSGLYFVKVDGKVMKVIVK